jgi:hypothetical protein
MYSKLINLGLPLDVWVSPGHPARALPYAELLPGVASATYGGLDYKRLKMQALPAFTPAHQLRALAEAGVRVCLEANSHLEAGRQLEQWLPDLPTLYHYPMNIEPHAGAADVLYPVTPEPYVLVYASSMGSVKAWSGWLAHDWANFMLSLRQRVADVPFVLTGAAWDAQLGIHVEQTAKHAGLRITNLIGKTHIGSTLRLMQRASYFVSFPSGLGILANVINVPATMLYPPQIRKIMGTWADPETLKSNRFKECLFCPPDQLAAWIQDVYKLKDNLKGGAQ